MSSRIVWYTLYLSYCYLILSVFLHPFIRRVDIDLALSGVGTVPSVLCTHLISWACLLLAVSVPWHFHFGLASALTLLILKMPPFVLMTFSDAPHYCVAASLYGYPSSLTSPPLPRCPSLLLFQVVFFFHPHHLLVIVVPRLSCARSYGLHLHRYHLS